MVFIGKKYLLIHTSIDLLQQSRLTSFPLPQYADSNLLFFQTNNQYSTYSIYCSHNFTVGDVSASIHLYLSKLFSYFLKSPSTFCNTFNCAKLCNKIWHNLG